MKVRRLGSALAAVAVMVACAVAVPSAANAGSYTLVIPPVEVLPPSATEFATLTPEEAAWRKLTMNPPKVSWWQEAGLKVNGLFSKMSPVARGNTVLLAGTAAFALTAGGVRVVYAASGQDWDASMCALDPIVREGYAFMSLGVGASDCSQGVITPNGDQPRTISLSSAYGSGSVLGSGTLTVGGTSYVYSCTRLNSGQVYYELVGGGRGGLYGGSKATDFCAGLGFGSANGEIAGSIARLYTMDGSGNVVDQALPVTSDPVRQYRCEKFISDTTGWEAYTSMVTGQESRGISLQGMTNTCDGVHFDWSNPPQKMRISELDPKTGNWTPIIEAPIPAEARQDAIDNQGCYDGSQQCTLTLSASKGTAVNQCLTGNPSACANWWTDTAQGTQPLTADGWKYECRFGTYVVALTRCQAYQEAFKPQTGTQPGVITDPNGNPIPSESTGGSTSPNTINPGAQVGGSNGSCMDTWFDDFNPIDWVLTPVKCALVWAFVPRTEVMTATQTAIAEAWAPTIVGRLPTVVADAIVIPDGGTGCTGPEVDIPIHFAGLNVDYHGYPLSACTEPMSTLAGWARLIGSAILIWATGLGIIRRASAVVNAPGVGGGSA